MEKHGRQFSTNNSKEKINVHIFGLKPIHIALVNSFFFQTVQIYMYIYIQTHKYIHAYESTQVHT